MGDQRPEPCCDETRSRPICPDCCAVCGDWKAVKPLDHCQACLEAYYARLDRDVPTPKGATR